MTKRTNNGDQYENEAVQQQTIYWCFCVPVASYVRRRQIPPTNSFGSPLHYNNIDISHVALRTFSVTPIENNIRCSRSLLRQNGQPSKILLFPEEGWARSASSSYWTLTPYWWNRSRCKVVEIAGTRRFTTKARLVDNGTGALYVLGSFKRMSSDSDFKLFLTSNVSSTDYNMGYCMTGTLERGSKKTNTFQMTHFAVIRRNDYDTTKM